MKVTVIVIAENDEAYLGKCLESAKWADELIVSDSFNSEGTSALASRYTAKLFQFDLKSKKEQREHSIYKSANKWILLLEPYEIISDELKEEILSLPEVSDFAAYKIYREIYCFGRPVKHCGFIADFQIRLFNREVAQVKDGIVYEEIEGNGRLKGMLRCSSGYGFTGLIKKMNIDSSIRSLELFEKGKRISKSGTIFGAIKAFALTYFIQLGFLDGIAGFYISFAGAATAFVTRLKLLKLLEKI